MPCSGGYAWFGGGAVENLSLSAGPCLHVGEILWDVPKKVHVEVAHYIILLMQSEP